MKSTPTILVLFALAVHAWSAPDALAADDGNRPQHLAATAGIARHNGKHSEFWGVDYAYTFSNQVYLLGFYEQVRGEFDISAYGLQVGKRFGSRWSVGVGPGIETKLKSGEKLALLRTTIGYGWHRGSWSYGPILSYDIIEDVSDTLYLGFTVGFGF